MAVRRGVTRDCESHSLPRSFPETSGRQAGNIFLITEADHVCGGHGFHNCISVTEHSSEVESELTRGLQVGFLSWFADNEALESEVGLLILCKVQ